MGARRKVEQLEGEFSQLLSPSIARASGVSGTPDLQATTAMAVQTLLPSTESLPLHDGEQESQKL
jgi:hypothetical protein